MLDAAVKALDQLLSRPFRAVLLKSVALAVVLLAVVGIAVDRALVALLEYASRWLDATAGAHGHILIEALAWLLAVATGLGIIAGAVFLIPAVTAIVASLFVDDIAAEVERVHYPADPPGRPLPILFAVTEGIKAALLSLVVYLLATPLLLVLGSGFIIFFVATAYVQGRIYFEFAAMRFHSIAEAKRLRRVHHAPVFIGGLFIAAFLSVPIVSLATPLFGTAMMLHLYKRLASGPMSRISDRSRIGSP